MSEQTKDTSLEAAANYVDDFMDIPEEYLPDVLSQRLDALKEIRSAYKKAQDAATDAEAKSKAAVRQATALLGKANNSGNHKAEVHNFLFLEWSTKGDKIEAIENNLKELIECGIDSAEAQKALADVQAAFATAQTELLKVQAKQMEYESQIADVSKYLFGLSAKNMADANSVLIELNARLEGASEEEIGEMAKQQLLAAMDQLKSQENIKKRLLATEGNISDQSKRLDDIETVDETQTAELLAQAQQNKVQDDELARQAEKDMEHDKELARQAEKDEEHDKELARQAAKDMEHDKELARQAEKDAKHDQLLAQQAKKDEEHDQLLAQLAAKAETYDDLFAQQELTNAEHDRLFAQQEEKDLDHDRRLDEQAEALDEHGGHLNDLDHRADEHDSTLAQYGTDIAGNADTIKEQAAAIAQLNEEIADLKLALETKASKKSDLVSLVLAGISLLGVIIHFCI